MATGSGIYKTVKVLEGAQLLLNREELRALRCLVGESSDQAFDALYPLLVDLLEDANLLEDRKV